MISPLRGDVLVVGFLLALPVFLLALRGDLTANELVTRLPWCLAAGWAAVALVRWASTPPPPTRTAATPDPAAPQVADAAPAGSPLD